MPSASEKAPPRANFRRTARWHRRRAARRQESGRRRSERHEVTVAEEGVATPSRGRAFRITHVGVRPPDDRNAVRRRLFGLHPAGAVIAAHLLHAAGLELFDDRVELRLALIENARYN